MPQLDEAVLADLSALCTTVAARVRACSAGVDRADLKGFAAVLEWALLPRTTRKRVRLAFFRPGGAARNALDAARRLRALGAHANAHRLRGYTGPWRFMQHRGDGRRPLLPCCAAAVLMGTHVSHRKNKFCARCIPPRSTTALPDNDPAPSHGCTRDGRPCHRRFPDDHAHSP